MHESLADVGVESTIVPREDLREEIGSDAYYGGIVVPDSGLVHPGRLLRRARRCGGPGRRRPARGRPGTDDPAPGRRPLRGRDRARAPILARDVLVATNGYTDGVAPVAASTDHPDRELHHRQRAAPRGPGRASSRRTAARSSTRRTSCTTGTSRRTGGWSSAGGRASCRPRSTGRPRSSTGGCSRSIRSWPAGGSSTRGAATSGSRSTGCRMSGGRRTASPTRWAAAGPASR